MQLGVRTPPFADLLPRPFLVGVVAEAAGIEFGRVEAVCTLGDTFRQIVADCAAPQDTARDAFRDPDILQPPGRAAAPADV